MGQDGLVKGERGVKGDENGSEGWLEWMKGISANKGTVSKEKVGDSVRVFNKFGVRN